MRTNISDKLSTDTAYINQLISDIKQGEVKIPQFQRKFVWQEQQALDILDSIANRYPIGSILLWKTKDKLQAERNIGNFRLPETDDLTPTNYVLDGQQRLTVIYSCLGTDEQDEGFRAGYDLVNEIFVELKEKMSNPTIFPLRKIFRTTSLLNYRTALLAQPESELLQARLDNIISAFTQYKLPVVTLKDLTLDEVCPIFERINSSGTKLSTYDLMVAATWKVDFDLNDKVDEILSILEDKGYGDTERSTILKALSAIKLGSIKEKSLKTMRGIPTQEMQELTEKTKEALKRSVDALSTHFGIHSWDFLSYEAILLILTYLFCEKKELNAQEARRMRKWFWRSSFGERYKVGGENFVSNDVNIVSEFILHGKGDENNFGFTISPGEWGKIQFRSNVSRSRAFILTLASVKPRNLTNGIAIDTANALSAYNKKEYHHVYPKAYLTRIGKGSSCNILGNIIMITANSNKLVSDASPSEYFPRIIADLDNNADRVFESNLLPKPKEFSYEKATYEEFLEARGKILSNYVDKHLLG